MNYSKLADDLMMKMLQFKKKRSKILSPIMPGDVVTLDFLTRQKEAVTPGEISEKMDMSTAHVAKLLGSLERQGFVERNVDPADRRRVHVTATEEGRALMTAHRAEICADTTRLLSQLGEHDAQEFLRILDRIIEISKREDMDD